MNKAYIKSVWFERNIQTGQMEVMVESNYGPFTIGHDALDYSIINRVYDYIKEKATNVINRHIADQAQEELKQTSEDRAREALKAIDLPQDIEVKE